MLISRSGSCQAPGQEEIAQQRFVPHELLVGEYVRGSDADPALADQPHKSLLRLGPPPDTSIRPASAMGARFIVNLALSSGRGRGARAPAYHC